jgi:THO complex subunit 2
VKKETIIKLDKKVPIRAPSSLAPSTYNLEKEASRKERASRDPSVHAIREKTPKEIKKEERQREKERERDEVPVKREKERRRDKRAPSPSFETPPTERYYPSSTDHYEHERDRGEREPLRGERERERGDRDLSSVSNSSNGSIHRRSPEPPEHDRGE